MDEKYKYFQKEIINMQKFYSLNLPLPIIVATHLINGKLYCTKTLFYDKPRTKEQIKKNIEDSILKNNIKSWLNLIKVNYNIKDSSDSDENIMNVIAEFIFSKSNHGFDFTMISDSPMGPYKSLFKLEDRFLKVLNVTNGVENATYTIPTPELSELVRTIQENNNTQYTNLSIPVSTQGSNQETNLVSTQGSNSGLKPLAKSSSWNPSSWKMRFPSFRGGKRRKRSHKDKLKRKRRLSRRLSRKKVR